MAHNIFLACSDAMSDLGGKQNPYFVQLSDMFVKRRKNLCQICPATWTSSLIVDFEQRQ